MDFLLQFWVFLCCMFLIAETATPSLFYFFSGAVGSLGALIFYALGFEFTIQALAFIITATITLILIKNILQHHTAFKMHSHQRSNVDALIGKKAFVTSTIFPTKRGYVKLDGDLWAAENIFQKELSVGTEVEIVSVSGSHVKVKPIIRRKESL